MATGAPGGTVAGRRAAGRSGRWVTTRSVDTGRAARARSAGPAPRRPAPFWDSRSGTTSTAPQRSSPTARRLPRWRSVLRTPLSSWDCCPPPTVPGRPSATDGATPGRGWTGTTPPSRPPHGARTGPRLRNDRSEERPQRSTLGRSPRAGSNPRARPDRPGSGPRTHRDSGGDTGRCGRTVRMTRCAAPGTSLVAAALLALALPVAAGCSSSARRTTTTTAAARRPPTTAAPSAFPATGSVDGFTLSVTSSPAHRAPSGHTTIARHRRC